MSDAVHLEHLLERTWCGASKARTAGVDRVTCLACLLACAEYGSEARHRREVLIEAGAKL